MQPSHVPAMHHELELPGLEARGRLCAVRHHRELGAAVLVAYGGGLRDGVEVSGDRLGDVEVPRVSVVQGPFLESSWRRRKGRKGEAIRAIRALIINHVHRFPGRERGP